MEFALFSFACQSTLGLAAIPEPEADFRNDLNLDDLEMFAFVLKFNDLAAEHSTVRSDIS